MSKRKSKPAASGAVEATVSAAAAPAEASPEGDRKVRRKSKPIGKAEPAQRAPDAGVAAEPSEAPKPLSAKAYDKALKKLHVELVKLQEWVRHKGLKVCIVFEGRDGAGKGGKNFV